MWRDGHAIFPLSILGRQCPWISFPISAFSPVITGLTDVCRYPTDRVRWLRFSHTKDLEALLWFRRREYFGEEARNIINVFEHLHRQRYGVHSAASAISDRLWPWYGPILIFVLGCPSRPTVPDSFGNRLDHNRVDLSFHQSIPKAHALDQQKIRFTSESTNYIPYCFVTFAIPAQASSQSCEIPYLARW